MIPLLPPGSLEAKQRPSAPSHAPRSLPPSRHPRTQQHYTQNSSPVLYALFLVLSPLSPFSQRTGRQRFHTYTLLRPHHPLIGFLFALSLSLSLPPSLHQPGLHPRWGPLPPPLTPLQPQNLNAPPITLPSPLWSLSTFSCCGARCAVKCVFFCVVGGRRPASPLPLSLFFVPDPPVSCPPPTPAPYYCSERKTASPFPFVCACACVCGAVSAPRPGGPPAPRPFRLLSSYTLSPSLLPFGPPLLGASLAHPTLSHECFLRFLSIQIVPPPFCFFLCRAAAALLGAFPPPPSLLFCPLRRSPPSAALSPISGIPPSSPANQQRDDGPKRRRALPPEPAATASETKGRRRCTMDDDDDDDDDDDRSIDDLAHNKRRRVRTGDDPRSFPGSPAPLRKNNTKKRRENFLSYHTPFCPIHPTLLTLHGGLRLFFDTV